MQQSPSFLAALLGLCFVLGLIILCSYLAKRFIVPKINLSKNGKVADLELLEMKQIDIKNKLVLCRCKNKEYLLLCGEKSVVVDQFEHKVEE
ncbi:MAG: hypothetical protein MJ250_01490 [Alphaproteobacteria bacterium]|nr:hypothetical protein [Alphaproteobacteria bacterium]